MRTFSTVSVVLCGKKGELFNNTFGMLWSDGEKPTTTFLQYPTILTPIRAIQDIGVGHEKAELTKTLPSCQDS